MPKPLDLTGRKVGRLTVIRRVENAPAGYARWLCVCKCGKQTVVKATYLSRERTRSCGCGWHDARQIRNANNFRDLTNKKFDRLKVIDMAFRRKGAIYWRCLCKCGNEMIVNGKSLKSKATRSCGCLQRERASAYQKKNCWKQPRLNGPYVKKAA